MSNKRSRGFTAEENAAIRDRAQELKVGKDEGGGESAVLAKIAAMPEPDRSMGRRIHDIVMNATPSLVPRLWYGMPAYTRGGKVVCHFQPAHKFKTRYATLGFSDRAALDQGSMWPVAFAVEHLSAAEEAKIVALLKKAVG